MLVWFTPRSVDGFVTGLPGSAVADTRLYVDALLERRGGIRLTSADQVIRTLEEPTAAALAFGLHRKPNVNHILVYDLGGGTLDVSILFVNDGSVEVLGSDGDNNLGGEILS